MTRVLVLSASPASLHPASQQAVGSTVRPALAVCLPDSGLPARHRLIAIACVLATMALVVLDAAIVNVALPTLAKSLKVTPANAVLTVSAYQMALVMALLPAAALGESLGLRRVFTFGIILFAAASLLCAAAPSLPWLVATRFLKGIGGPPLWRSASRCCALRSQLANSAQRSVGMR